MSDKIQTEAMKEYEAMQYDPYLGIGWVLGGQLVDISKQFASECRWNVNGCRTISALHKDYWHRMNMKQIYKHKNRASVYSTDYTQIPRFRIFEYKEQPFFRVMVGSWINGDIEEMITDEFDLPEDTAFIVDIHWELGHGWSEEYMFN